MGSSSAIPSLQTLIDTVPNIVDYLFHNQKGVLRRFSNLAPPSMLPVEFTNWRDEVRARRETVALLDQSFHMTNLYLRGPGAFPLLQHLAINSFANFRPGRAKHFVACNPEGFIIGDGILYYLEDNSFVLVGSDAVTNWVEYNAHLSGSDVETERDPSWPQNTLGRRSVYRFQIEGPNAFLLLEKLLGRPMPEIKSFHTGWLTISGRRVLALRHTMAGMPGLELSGPWEDREFIRDAIIAAGDEFGLRVAGTLAYFTSGALETGWIPLPLPAIYTSPSLRSYREWLPATSFEATGSLGGSFYSPHIEDYYLDPWDIGVHHLLNFDHEFVGKESLQRRVTDRHRTKVTLVWNPDDTARVFRSLFDSGPIARYMDFPFLHYSLWQYDKILNRNGDLIGLALYAGYNMNERAVLTLAVIDAEYSTPGTEVNLIWGEEDGGARSTPWLEQHTPIQIRATVGPVPFSIQAREYRARLRHK